MRTSAPTRRANARLGSPSGGAVERSETERASFHRRTLSAPVCALGHLPQRGRQEKGARTNLSGSGEGRSLHRTVTTTEAPCVGGNTDYISTHKSHNGGCQVGPVQNFPAPEARPLEPGGFRIVSVENVKLGGGEPPKGNRLTGATFHAIIKLTV